MPLLSASLDSFIFSCIVIALSWSFFVHQRSPETDEAVTRRPPWRARINILLLVHSLYIAYCFTVAYPENIFKVLRLPMNVHCDRIRAVLLERAEPTAAKELPRGMERLLTRLCSADSRVVLIRFGQQVLEDCEHCHTIWSFAAYGLPAAMKEYLHTASILAVVTSSANWRSHWRKPILALLAIGAASEAYCVLQWEVSLSRPRMLYYNFYTLRQLLFGALPLVVHILLPARLPRPPPVAALAAATTSLQGVVNTQNVLRWLHGAAARTSGADISAWWARERAIGAAVRADDNVQHKARSAEHGFWEEKDGQGDGPLRTKARESVMAMMNGLRTMLGSEP